jgi:hypothetical protein
MNRTYVRRLVVSFGAALVAAAAATAAEPDRLVVSVPFDFVVDGKTMPAGKYDVKRVDDSNLRILSISSLENHATVVTISNSVDNPAKFHPGFTLQETGDQRILTKIQTGEHVFQIAVSAKSAAAKSKRATSVTGTSESR